MASEVIYFQDTNGNAWQGYTEYGPAQKAIAIVDPSATKATLELDIAIQPTGCGCVAMLGASILSSLGSFLLSGTGGGGQSACGTTLVNSYCHGPDGKNDPVTSVSMTYDITNYINFSVDKSIAIVLQGCYACYGIPTNIEWHMNVVSVTYEIPSSESYGNVTVTVTAESSFASGASVSLINQQTGTGPTSSTNSSGIASFSEIPVGSYTLNVQYGTFQGSQKTIAVQSGTQNFPVNLGCGANQTYCQGACYDNCGTGTTMDISTCKCTSSQVQGIIAPVLELVAAVAGVIVVGGIVATVHKAVPSGKERYKLQQLEYPAQRPQLQEGQVIEGNAQQNALPGSSQSLAESMKTHYHNIVNRFKGK